MRSIGKNARLESFLIGNDFDIKYEIKKKEEREKYRQEQQGTIEGNYYVNKLYNFKIKIPENWDYNNYYSITEDLVDLFYLKLKNLN